MSNRDTLPVTERHPAVTALIATLPIFEDLQQLGKDLQRACTEDEEVVANERGNNLEFKPICVSSSRGRRRANRRSRAGSLLALYAPGKTGLEPSIGAIGRQLAYENEQSSLPNLAKTVELLTQQCIDHLKFIAEV